MKTTFRVSWDKLPRDPAFVQLEVTAGDLHVALAMTPAEAYQLAAKLRQNAARAIGLGKYVEEEEPNTTKGRTYTQ